MAASRQLTVGGKGPATLRTYPGMGELAKGLAEYVAQLAAEAQGAFTVVLSGGSLVKALGVLAEEPFKGSIDWSRWHVFWADERLVPLDNADSNYKAANDEFLSKVAIPPGQVYAINPSLPVEGAADDYETNLRHLVSASVLQTASPMGQSGPCPRFDLILLGMGPDGHVASLFPHHPLIKEASKWVAPISDSPKPPPERITLTFPIINAAAHIGFVTAGGGKADMLKTIFGDAVEEGSLPAQLVCPKQGELVWFVDEPAAAAL
eukprot:SM000648S20276  [mRNA]  locus=s648:208:1946:+ [translate_table: standard]